MSGIDVTEDVVAIAKHVAPKEENQRAYPLPGKSKLETNRLDGQHAIFTSRIGGLHHTAFPASSSPARVLDVGCGTGIWTRAFAAANPSSQVVGIDLNPPSERFVDAANIPRNCAFVKADFFDEWDNLAAEGIDAASSVPDQVTLPKQFDFIYIRMLMAAVSDWPALLRKVFKNLGQGGRIEVFEGLMEMNAMDGSTSKTSAAIRWFEMAQRYMAAHSVKWDAALNLPLQMREAGFDSIEEQSVKMKLYRDREEESWVGEDYARDMAGLVDGMSKRLRGDMSSILSSDEWDVLEVEAKRELMEDSEKRGFYTTLYIFIAQKS